MAAEITNNIANRKYMATIDFQLAPHRITACGIGLKGAKHTAAGNITKICNDIHTWFEKKPNRPIEECCTYVLDDRWNAAYLETYLVSSQKDDNGNFFFIFWNRSEKSGSSIYGINQSATSQNITKKENFGKRNLPKNHIQGFATYFWIIPSKDLLVNFIPESSKTCRGGFDEWVLGFIGKYSSYSKHSGNEFIGYDVNGSTIKEIDGKALWPRFSTRVLHSAPRITLLKENRTSIKSIVRHTKLRHVIQDERDMFFRMLGSSFYKTEDIVLKYEAAVQPTEEELNDMIDKCINDELIDKIGFTFPSGIPGLKTKEWLDKNFMRARYSENIAWIEAGAMIKPSSFKSAVLRKRDEFFEELKKTI